MEKINGIINTILYSTISYFVNINFKRINCIIKCIGNNSTSWYLSLTSLNEKESRPIRVNRPVPIPKPKAKPPLPLPCSSIPQFKTILLPSTAVVVAPLRVIFPGFPVAPFFSIEALTTTGVPLFIRIDPSLEQTF